MDVDLDLDMCFPKKSGLIVIYSKSDLSPT